VTKVLTALTTVYGPRYACLDCPRPPGFDYCYKCKSSSNKTHTSHEFREIYEDDENEK
jgi:hypothetical protein